MPRPFAFPDPNDRSPNDPSVTVQPFNILGLYNQATGEEKTRVVEAVKEWFVTEARATYGWPEASFAGNVAVLTRELPVIEQPDA
jgi:hypothetical protein